MLTETKRYSCGYIMDIFFKIRDAETEKAIYWTDGCGTLAFARAQQMKWSRGLFS